MNLVLQTKGESKYSFLLQLTNNLAKKFAYKFESKKQLKLSPLCPIENSILLTTAGK